VEPKERKAGAGGILLLLAVAMTFAGATVPGPSANEGVVRAVYYAAASIIVSMAVLVWSSS